MLRLLFTLAIMGFGVYWYAENRGLAVGFSPFTPVYYWKYTGQDVRNIKVRGVADSIKLSVSGQLTEGRATVEIRENGNLIARQVYKAGDYFFRDIKYKVDPGDYVVTFKLEGAKGQLYFDWVATRYKSI